MGFRQSDTFVFYPSFIEQVDAIKSDKVKFALLMAIARYGVYGEMPDFTEIDPMGVLDAVFLSVKSNIDGAKARRTQQQENGLKGGAPKGNKNAAKQPKSTENNRKQPKSTENNLYVECSMLDGDVDKKELSNESEKKGGVVVAARAATLTRREAFYNSLVPYVGKYGAEMIRAFFDYWSEMNKSETKMRFEQQPTWELAKRLATWAKRDRVEARPRLNAFGSTAADAKSQRDAEFVAHIQQKMQGG